MSTGRFWSGWSESLRLPQLHTELVRRSALALKALCYGPTGAIAAAGTTSLPEHLGGVRNWDYRYCWPRDATMAAAALVRLGNTGAALRLLDWLLGVIDHCESPDRLRPIYTVTGNHLGPEAEISELAGYGGSRPVRVGNAAASQVQLDVFGPITDLIALLAEHGAPISPDHWRLVRAMVQAVEARWHEPDHGIWEMRTHKQHHVHSKVMCWHSVNRALAVHEYIMGKSNAAWMDLRDRIGQDVLSRGWSAKAKAFTVWYGSEEVDAAALQIGLVGLVPAGDERYSGTVNAVATTLYRHGAAVRYRCDDGLPGRTAGFHLCASWLIEATARMGRVEDANRLLDEYVACRGPTDLYSEGRDQVTGEAAGNFPQAYSHLGLINAVLALSTASPVTDA